MISHVVSGWAVVFLGFAATAYMWLSCFREALLAYASMVFCANVCINGFLLSTFSPRPGTSEGSCEPAGPDVPPNAVGTIAALRRLTRVGAAVSMVFIISGVVTGHIGHKSAPAISLLFYVLSGLTQSAVSCVLVYKLRRHLHERGQMCAPVNSADAQLHY